ncbi:MAG: WD40 repeat domain-containing protein [Thermomicrobiales bacterium]
MAEGAPASTGLTRRRLLLGGALTLPLVLAGYWFTRQPAHPAPPPPTSTVIAQLPLPAIGTPTVAPTAATPAPATTPARRATVTAMPNFDLQRAGRLLFTTDNPAGIAAIDADGGNRRRLTLGVYDGLTWAPDGSRFAAVGAALAGSADEQVAIFASDGQPLARYGFAGTISRGLAWSPDSRHVLCRIRPHDVDYQEDQFPYITQLLDDDGVHAVTLAPDPYALLWGWTPAGQLAFLSTADNTYYGLLAVTAPVTVWTTRVDGSDPRMEATGTFRLLDWTPDGQTLYALGDLALVSQPGVLNGRFPHSLIALDRATGTQRTIITVATLAAASDNPSAPHWLDSGLVAPGGRRIALWLSATAGSVMAGTPELSRDTTLVLVDTTGQVLASETLHDSVLPVGLAWSPDGQRLAYFVLPASNDQNELHILAPGAGALIYAVDATTTVAGAVATWSPDGRWIAFAGPAGLAIGAAQPPAHTYPLVPGGLRPAWRPR